MNLLNSLSVRLTLMYVGVFCLSVMLLGAIYYRITVVEPRDALKALAAQDFAAMKVVDDRLGRQAMVQALKRRAQAVAARKTFHALIEPSGRIVTADLPSWPRQTGNSWLEVEADISSEGVETDHYAILRDGRLTDGSRLLIGRDADEVYAREAQLRAAAAWLIGSTIALGIFGALVMTTAIRKRIDAINRAARTVIAGDLHGRVLVRGIGDDFDRLAETLNIMLSRIETLFEAVRRVSDSVAHELRTPLTRLISHLDRMAESEASGRASEQQLDAALREARRLHRILNATLSISRVEGRRYEARLVPVRLTLLAEDVCDYYVPEADRRSITLEVGGQDEVTVEGDPDLLFQAVSNLVDNALKFSPAGGRVRIEAERDVSGTVLSVADNGPGLEPGEAERVTERFFRGAAGCETQGEGLGLSLVAAIAEWHGATLTFRAMEPGLRVEIRWPSQRVGEG